MNDIFNKHKEALQQEINNNDTEAAHGNADGILCDIAIDASKGLLNEDEVHELIKMYGDVPKWYA